MITETRGRPRTPGGRKPRAKRPYDPAEELMKKVKRPFTRFADLRRKRAGRSSMPLFSKNDIKKTR